MQELSESSRSWRRGRWNEYESEKRYSVNNRPPSLRDANEALEDVHIETARIEAQLKYRGPEFFDTIKEFLEWKSSAISALGYTWAEMKYLEKFVGKARGRELAEKFKLSFTEPVVVTRLIDIADRAEDFGLPLSEDDQAAIEGSRYSTEQILENA